VTVQEAAEILYGSDHPVLAEKVTRLAQANVLASRVHGGLLRVRPANVTVHGRLPA
jgi:hypothetical protein